MEEWGRARQEERIKAFYEGLAGANELKYGQKERCYRQAIVVFSR